jgi:flagellar hook assembly protein FlgD
MIDQQAGYSAWGLLPEGVATENPVVVHKVPVNAGILDGRAADVPGIGFTVAPNPFHRTSTISYHLRRAEAVTLALLEVTGRCVRRLPGGLQPAGSYAIEWDGTDDRGRALPTGVYFCRIQAGSVTDSRRVAVAR